MNFRFPTNLALLITLLVAIAIQPSVPVKAQGGLSEEQLGLLDRMITAVTKVDDFTSYTDTESQELSLNGSIAIAGFTQEILQTQSMEKTTAYIFGDNPNALVIATYSESSKQQDGSTIGYTLDAEVRYVDGVLYAKGEVTDGEDPGISQSGAWVEVDIPTYAENLVISNLGLEQTLERLGAIERDETDDNPLRDIELLKKVATDVTAEEVTLEDGSTATAITVSIDFAALVAERPAALGAEDNPSSAALFSAFAGQSIVATVLISSDEMPISYGLNFEGSIVDLDASILSEQLTGATISLNLTLNQSAELSQVNEAIEPVAAPE